MTKENFEGHWEVEFQDMCKWYIYMPFKVDIDYGPFHSKAY